MKLEHNILRLKHLLKLYRMTVDELLPIISDGLKKPLTKKDVFCSNIQENHLKRIDKIFNKGILYYLDPSPPADSQDASIFFRKSKFGTDLNIGAKKIVNKFEDTISSISVMAKLAEVNLDRSTPKFQISDSPKEVAKMLRGTFYPAFNKDKKVFLKSLFSKLADHNIFVFEFVETWNKIEKANIDGFYLRPNVIVLKRHQSALRKEIFSLAHELGHYLIDEEEIEQVMPDVLPHHQASNIEQWCNDFAYFFLAGNYDTEIAYITKVDETNDYYYNTIKQISNKTHLSELSLYTRLFYDRKLSRNDYNLIKTNADEKYQEYLDGEKRKKEIDKLLGKKNKGRSPKPINSPLLISTVQTAFYEGIINEYDVCQTLNINANKLSTYIQ